MSLRVAVWVSERDGILRDVHSNIQTSIMNVQGQTHVKNGACRLPWRDSSCLGLKGLSSRSESSALAVYSNFQ